MFCDHGYFMKYELSIPRETIAVGDAHHVPVVGRGSIVFQTKLPQNGYRSITLDNVLHVPILAANLISLGTLQKAGSGVWSYDQGLVITDNKDSQELFRASFHGSTGTLYHISTLTQHELAYVTSSGSLRLWHRRMGHLHLDAIREMKRKDLVEGLDLRSPEEFDFVCEGCILGKSHRLEIPKKSNTKYEKIDLIAIDLTRPMSHATWNGSLYALVIIEVSTRFPVGRLLPSKDGNTVTQALKEKLWQCWGDNQV
jgi:hypothetical protein